MHNRLSWSIMWKAADKSRKTKNDSLPLPTIVTISLYSQSNAISQLCPCPKIHIEITFSITLDKKERFDTGLYFFHFSVKTASQSRVSQ